MWVQWRHIRRFQKISFHVIPVDIVILHYIVLLQYQQTYFLDISVEEKKNLYHFYCYILIHLLYFSVKAYQYNSLSINKSGDYMYGI